MEGPTLVDILLGALPMLLLIGAWYFFMRRMAKTNPFQKEVLDEMKRQTAIHERIAVALEKRGG